MEPFSRSAAEVAAGLEVDVRRGLAREDVARRRETFGPNRVVRDASRSAWSIFGRQFRSIVVALLAVAALISFLTRDAAEGVAILGVLLINALVGFIVEWRSERALESLRIQVRTTARVVRDGAQAIVDAEELVPGDVILLDPGAHVPADARVVESIALSVEEAALTGESVPVAKSSEAVAADAPLTERSSMLFLGTMATAGRGTAIVTATGEATELGKIGRLVRDVVLEATPLEKRLAALGRTLVWIVLAIGAIVATAGVLRGDPLWQMVEVGISLAVAAVPEGLPAVTTLILSVGVLRMARRHAIVRKLPAVETLGSTTVICTDKTGTLTMNQLTVRAIDAPDRVALLRIGALCSDAVIEGDVPVGDPTEVALVVAAMDADINVAALRQTHRKIHEVPFDPSTRRMITVHETPDGGRFVALKGAPSVVLSMSGGLTAERQAELVARNAQLASSGLRVLAFASRNDDADLTSGFTFAGFAALADPPRPAAEEAIARAHEAGIRVVMLTGDQVETARAIARELRLSGDRPPVVVHARELATSDVTQLAREADVFARIAPVDKLRVVEALRDAGEIVAVTGDGVNDAPALRRADIGVAMGRSGTDAAKQTADLVLTDDNLGTVVAAIEEGRTIYANITKFVHLLFSHNLGEVIAVFTAIVAGLPLPLLPLQILWMNVVTDIFPAFALALEPSQPRRMVGRRHGGALSGPFLVLVAWQGVMLAAVALGAYLWALRTYGGGAHARTVALCALVAVQLGHTFNCRSRVASAFSGLFANVHVWAAAATVVMLQIAAITFAPLARLLDLTSVTRDDVLVVIACALIPIAIVEVQKWIVRRGSGGSSAAAFKSGGSATALHKRVVLLIAAICAVALLAAIEPLHRATRALIAAAEPTIQEHAVLGAFLFVALSALSAMVVFFSTTLLVPIAIEAFGRVNAFLLLWTGWILGGITAYTIGRLLGHRVVRWFVDPRRLRLYEERAKLVVSFPHALLFQIAVPSEIPGYVLGLANCPFRTYVFAMALGELPFAIGAVYVSESFLERDYFVLLAAGLAVIALSWFAVGRAAALWKSHDA